MLGLLRKPYFGTPRRIAPTFLGPRKIVPTFLGPVEPVNKRSSKRSSGSKRSSKRSGKRSGSKRSGNVNICIDKCYEKYASQAPKNPFVVNDDDDEYVKLKKKQKNDFDEMISRIEKNYGNDIDDGVSVENLGKRSKRSKRKKPVILSMPKPTTAEAKENRRLRMEKRRLVRKNRRSVKKPSKPDATGAAEDALRRMSPPKKRGRGRPRKLPVVAFGGWFNMFKKEKNKPNEEEVTEAKFKMDQMMILHDLAEKKLLSTGKKTEEEKEGISKAMNESRENTQNLYNLVKSGQMTFKKFDESLKGLTETLQGYVI